MRRRWAGLALLVLVTAVWGAAAPVAARQGPGGRVDVFVGEDAETGLTRLYFLDALSGLSTVVNVESGRHFALVGDYVIYEKARTGAIMRANAQGMLEPHPFIRRGVGIEQIRWAASPDGSAIAWVEVSADGVSSLFVAQADGSGLRQLPISTPGAGKMLLPLALSNGMTQLVYDAAHPLESPSGALFEVYEYLSVYRIEEERFVTLAGEPICPCAAAAAPDGRTVSRLEAAEGRGPFALRVWDVPTGAETLVPAPNLPYRLAGDLILNETGTLAAYSAATAGGPPYALIVVDAVGRRQRLARSSETVRYRPLAFIDADSALLLTDALAGGTFKLDLTTGELIRVSDKRYLGAIGLP